jgi:hypothetical protein
MVDLRRGVGTKATSRVNDHSVRSPRATRAVAVYRASGPLVLDMIGVLIASSLS